jgi:cell division septation protein DedD
VPEPLHADNGFHEIQLSGKQLVFLFMATTVVAVVIFLCGVLVGRGVRPANAAGPSAATSLGTAAAAAPDVPAQTAGAPAPAGGTPGTPEDLSYHRRLQGEAGTSAPAASAEDQLKARESEPPKPVDPPTPADQPKPADAPAPTPAAPPAPVASARPTGPEGGWVVQIAALKDRGAADAIVRRLASKGFPTFVVEAAPGQPATGYRVRVGRYADRREAERIARRLEREEQFRPFITR